MDFAIASGLRADLLFQVQGDPNTGFELHEHSKREFLGTAAQAQAHGFHFMPLVMEAHAGAWSPSARRVLDALARKAAAALREESTTMSLRIVQRLSVTLQMENARAILKRMVPVDPTPWEPSPDGWAGAEAQASDV